MARADLSFESLRIGRTTTKMVGRLPMNERYIKLYTPWLSREFEWLCLEIAADCHWFFPTSFGRYYQNKDFGLVGSVCGYVDADRLTVYCPDAIDPERFYNKSIHPADRMRTQNAYENVIMKGVKHWLDDGIWRGHDWNYWRDMLPYYLSVL